SSVNPNPNCNLDSDLRLKFMHLFETLHKNGTTIIFATHDETLTSMFPHHVLRLKNGRLLNQQEYLVDF
ncbi:MAG: hypothetical protein WCL30_06965, partial [Pseudomonadota bacterium]